MSELGFLAVPELDQIFRFLILGAIFGIPIVRSILRALGVTKPSGPGPQSTRPKAARAEPRRNVLEELFGLQSEELPSETSAEDLGPPLDGPAAEPSPSLRPQVQPRLVRAASATDGALDPYQLTLPPTGSVVRRPAKPAPVTSAEQVEAGVLTLHSAVRRRGELEEAPAPPAPLGGRRSRLAPQGWKRAMVLREVLGAPRAYEELDPR